MYVKIPSAEKSRLKDFIARAYWTVFGTTQTRQSNKFSKLQEKIVHVGFRTKEQKDDSYSIKTRAAFKKDNKLQKGNN